MNTNDIQPFTVGEELAAIQRGHERGLVTDEELSQRLSELELLLLGAPQYRQNNLSVSR